MSLTRSITHRIFIGLFCAVFAPALGFFLYSRYTNGDPARGQDWVLQVFVFLVFEVIGMVFLGSLLGIIWALFTPAWIERQLRDSFLHFWIILLGIAFFLTCIMMWSLFFPPK